MNTPIYDTLKIEQWCKEIDTEFAALSLKLGHTVIAPNPVDSPARKPWPLEGTRIISKPEPRWRTFLRCLLWWLP